MRRLLVFSTCIVLLGSTLINAQETDTTSFTLIDEIPVYPGGDSALLRYLSEESNYPKECLKKGVIGCVFVRYTVNRLGMIENAHVFLSGNELFDKEALRVVNSIYGYRPGRVRGKSIPVQLTIPIKFVFDGCSKEAKLNLDKKIARQLYNLGVKEYEQGNYGLAKSLFWQALQKSDSWFYEAFLARGKSFMMTHAYDLALKDFDSALQIDSLLVDAHLSKAKTYLLKNDNSNATNSFKKVLQLDDQHAESLLYLGNMYYAKSEYDLASDYFEKLVIIDKTQGMVYHALGICYAKRRNVTKACENMRSAAVLGINEAELFIQNLCSNK